MNYNIDSIDAKHWRLTWNILLTLTLKTLSNSSSLTSKLGYTISLILFPRICERKQGTLFL